MVFSCLLIWTTSISTNMKEKTVNVILAKHYIKLPDDGSICDPKHVGAILNIFKYFIIILIVSTNYIFVHLLDNEMF